MREIIHTEEAPAAIGSYSQAVRVGSTIYVSGQIPLEPNATKLISNHFKEQAKQVFKNLTEIANASGGSLHNFVKLNVYLTDLDNFAELNEVMQHFFSPPYPARAAIEVSALPKGALIEIEGTIHLP